MANPFCSLPYLTGHCLKLNVSRNEIIGREEPYSGVYPNFVLQGLDN